MALFWQVAFQYDNNNFAHWSLMSRHQYDQVKINEYLIKNTNTHDVANNGVWVFKLNTAAGDPILQPPQRGTVNKYIYLRNTHF
mgnify:FL=1